MNPVANALAYAAEKHQIPVSHILSNSKLKHYAHARQTAYLVAYANGATMPQIARDMGRDHSTVSHGLHAALKRVLDENAQLRAKLGESE